MSAIAVDWSPMDSADWEVEPPPVQIDSVFLAEATLLAARKILDNRVAKMKSARRQLDRAAAAMRSTQHEVDLAIKLVEEALRDWAKTKGEAA